MPLAQRIVRWRDALWTDDQILDQLRGLLKRVGRLTATIINVDRAAPSVAAIQRRFGGLLEAYKLIGYTPNRNYEVIEQGKLIRVRPKGMKPLMDEVYGAVRSGRLSENLTYPQSGEPVPGGLRRPLHAPFANAPRLERDWCALVAAGTV